MRISDWSSDVCSSDLLGAQLVELEAAQQVAGALGLTVEQQGAIFSGALLGEKEFMQELALGRQEGAPDRALGRHPLHVVGDDALQEGAAVGARHLEDAAMLQNHCRGLRHESSVPTR